MSHPFLHVNRPVESLPPECKTLAIVWNCQQTHIAVEQVNILLAFGMALLLPFVFAAMVSLWWKAWGRRRWEHVVEEDEKLRSAWRQRIAQQRHMEKARRTATRRTTRAGRHPPRCVEPVQHHALTRIESDPRSSTSDTSTHAHRPLLTWQPPRMDLRNLAPPAHPPAPIQKSVGYHPPRRPASYRKRPEELTPFQFAGHPYATAYKSTIENPPVGLVVGTSRVPYETSAARHFQQPNYQRDDHAGWEVVEV